MKNICRTLIVMLVLAMMVGIASFANTAEQLYIAADKYGSGATMPVSIYDVPVGTTKSFTIKLPDSYGKKAVPLAILFLSIDDIDSRQEATITLNGHALEIPDSLLGEGPHNGYIKLNPTYLKPGVNEFNLSFISDLGGDTEGWLVDDAFIAIARPGAPLPQGKLPPGVDSYISASPIGTLAVYNSSLEPPSVKIYNPPASTAPVTRTNLPSSVEVGNDVLVASGKTVEDAVAMLGDITIAGHVTGDAAAIVGTVTVLPGGVVDGDVVSPCGSVRIMSGGKVGGDVVGIGGGVYKADGAEVGGETVNIGWGGLNLKHRFIGYPGQSGWLDALNSLLYGIGFAVLSAVLYALFPKRMENVAEVSLAKAGQSALYGILGIIIAVFGVLVLIATCIGIPIAVVGIIAFIVAWIFGRMAIGFALGKKIGEAVNRPMIPNILTVFLGTIVLALINLVPFVGGLVVWVLTLLGFGAIIITGFGASPTWWQDLEARRAQHALQNRPPTEKTET